MRVSTRVFVPRFEPKSLKTSQKLDTKSPSALCGQDRGSEKGVTDCTTSQDNDKLFSIVVVQENENSVSIDNDGVKSRTSYHNNRGVTNQSTVDNSNHGHINDTLHDSHNGFEMSLGDKSSNQRVSSMCVNISFRARAGFCPQSAKA